MGPTSHARRGVRGNLLRHCIGGQSGTDVGLKVKEVQEGTALDALSL